MSVLASCPCSAGMFIQVAQIGSSAKPRPLGELRSFSPTDNCDCLDSNLPRNASHRWRERDKETERERERGRKEVGLDGMTCLAGFPKMGRCALSDTLVAPRGCKHTPHDCVVCVCVCVCQRLRQPEEATEPLWGTLQGAVFPSRSPGADFHPRWAGRRLRSLLVWHSLEDLGGRDGRHTAIHGHVTGNRKAVPLHRYFPVTSLSLSLFRSLSLFDKRYA